MVYPAKRVADVALILAGICWDDIFEAECKLGFLYGSAFSLFELLAVLVPNHSWFRAAFRRAVQSDGRADWHCMQDAHLQRSYYERWANCIEEHRKNRRGIRIRRDQRTCSSIFSQELVIVVVAEVVVVVMVLVR